VEFFASAAIVEKLEKAVAAVNGVVDFLAGNNAGELKTSMQDTERNAVTWGVFPGQEIIQSTIIEQESFLTWKVRASSLPLCSRLISDPHERCPAGGGIFNLDGLGDTISSRLAGTTVT